MRLRKKLVDRLKLYSDGNARFQNSEKIKKAFRLGGYLKKVFLKGQCHEDIQ